MRRIMLLAALAACDPAPAVGEVVTVGEAAARLAEGMCRCEEDWVLDACVGYVYGRICDNRDCSARFAHVRDLELCEEVLWSGECPRGVPDECVNTLLDLEGP